LPGAPPKLKEYFMKKSRERGIFAFLRQELRQNDPPRSFLVPVSNKFRKTEILRFSVI
jgi:hypothetical protein